MAAHPLRRWLGCHHVAAGIWWSWRRGVAPGHLHSGNGQVRRLDGSVRRRDRYGRPDPRCPRVGGKKRYLSPTNFAGERGLVSHLPAMLRGEAVWCQLFSEPDAGSDLAGLTTRATRDGEAFVVNGQKVWTSGAQHSDWGILIARTNQHAPKHRGITYFLVDMQTPGIEVRPLRQITGSAHFNEVYLTDVVVSAGNVVGGIDDGWSVAHTTMSYERALIGGIGQSISTAQVLDLAHRCDKSDDPLVRQQIVDYYTRVQLLRVMNYRVQTALSKGRLPGPEASTTKLFVSQHMSLNGELFMNLVGANGLLAGDAAVDDGFWETAFLNQWTSRLGGGTDNIQRTSLAERVLGLPREPRSDKDQPFSDTRRAIGSDPEQTARSS